jgi:predicted dehydrogenase
MARVLRVGLVGYGFASKTFHAPLIDGVDGLTLAVISSSDAVKVALDWPHVKVVDDPQLIFADKSIDLVVIPTPNTSHYPLAQQVLPPCLAIVF